MFDLVHDHLKHHDQHTLGACTVCLVLGYILRMLMNPRLPYHDRIVNIFDRNGDGRIDAKEVAFVEAAMAKAETVMLKELPRDIMKRKGLAFMWLVVSAICFVVEIVILYRFKKMLGLGSKFRLVAVLCSAPLALAMVRRHKELRAVKHLNAMLERFSTPEDDSVSNEVADTEEEAAESKKDS
mmetsp:Transcript_124329/g.247893  ORF Transcript_124329/g.247893 Transcript_124329/m.247893 type:complete len:183 (-) Transcript_124329:81-629(-)